MAQVDEVKNIQEIKNYCDVFYLLKNLTEWKILKIRILKQNIAINYLKSSACETFYS